MSLLLQRAAGNNRLVRQLPGAANRVEHPNLQAVFIDYADTELCRLRLKLDQSHRAALALQQRQR